MTTRTQFTSRAALLLMVTITAAHLAACSGSRRLADRLMPIEMVAVEGGSFLMGDVHDYEDVDATPVHRTTLPDFRIAATETTFEQYDTWASLTGNDVPDDDGLGRGARAVVNVTWDVALAFCKTYGYRLPSEVEWEYAAREGGRNLRWSGTDDPDSVDAYVRHEDNGEAAATYVGTRRPNALGLYDMSGNVFEWIGAYYAFYRASADSVEYHDLSIPGVRIVRGGSVRTPANITQTFWRSGTLNDATSEMIGFRCAADTN